MKIDSIPFAAIQWDEIPKEEHEGATGKFYSKTFELSEIRIRLVEYTPGYLADHWCDKGHIIHVLSGSFESERKDGQRFTHHAGTSFCFSDNKAPHRGFSKDGATLLIID